jgi:hypothetical protein
MRVTGLALALVVGAAAVLVAIAAPAEGKRPSACQRLKGKDLAPAPKVKLVRRRNDESGTDLRGCVLPRGRVRLVAASADHYTSFDEYQVLQVAGAVVLIGTTYGDQYVGVRSTSVFDIRSGRDYGIANHCSRMGVDCGLPSTTAAAAFVNRRAQAAAAVVSWAGDTTTIAGFSSRGERTDFDSGPSADIPAASLELHGSTVSWTHSGEQRTATITE